MPSRPRGRQPLALLSVALLVVVVGFTVANLRPGLWFTDTTPTGGDLGAHVWGPAYLRDVLLPQWRLTGWTQDWYAGFPAFTFYMVVPSLLVVIVNAGLAVDVSVFAVIGAAAASAAVAGSLARRLRPPMSKRTRRLTLALAASAAVLATQILNLLDGKELGVGPLGALTYNDALVDRALAALALPAACGYWAWKSLRSWPRIRLGASIAAGLIALGLAPLPYGASLKLVAIIGVALLPAASWAMARIAGVSPAGQAMMAAATLLLIFDQSYNIYGGNLMSTMAGEFAYTLGLACAVVYIGVAAAGMDRNRHRILAGALLALTGLAHLFTAFFALGVTLALIVAPPLARPRLGELGRRVAWTLTTGMLAAALSAWWVLPFWWNRGFLNDMGWGKDERYMSALWSRSEFDYEFLVNWPPLQVFAVLAVIGSVVCAVRRVRLGTALAITAAMFAAAFILLPEGRLWNVRIIPFYYFTIYLLAGLCVSEVSSIMGRQVQRSLPRRAASHELVRAQPIASARRWGDAVAGFSVVAAVVSVLVTVALPMRSLPGARFDDDGAYGLGPLRTEMYNLGPYWVQYNFEGYENRDPNDEGGGSAEYWDLVSTMRLIGESRGCGSSLWEYDAGRLGSYGTPMAPMLLPYWTQRCIGSMEGLFFEASATVPYHFLMQSELSESPSRAQRDLPYSRLDVDAGVEHMQLMGVRYYLAFSPEAIDGARANEALREITRSGPWRVFEMRESSSVTGLSVLPVVIEGLDASENSWLVASVGAFIADADRPMLAADGPQDWPRIDLPPLAGADSADGESGSRSAQSVEYDRREAMREMSEALPAAAPVREVVPAEVSDVRRDDHSISFTVDRTGVPVLVRTSYFPNWQASGAEGPYRVTPNLMVVVPTEHRVRVEFGRSPVELLAGAVSLSALALVLWQALRRRGPAPVDAVPPASASR